MWAVYKERTFDKGLAVDLLEMCVVFPRHSGDPHNPQHRQPCSHFTDEKTEARRRELTGRRQGWVQIKVCPIPKLRFLPYCVTLPPPPRHKGLISEVTQFLLSKPASWALCSLMRGPPLPQEPTCMAAGLSVLELLPPLGRKGQSDP